MVPPFHSTPHHDENFWGRKTCLKVKTLYLREKQQEARQIAESIVGLEEQVSLNANATLITEH